MSLAQFFDFINGFSGERPPSQRLGQWACNVLYESYPDVADAIRNSKADPYYDDSRMPLFLKAVLDYVK